MEALTGFFIFPLSGNRCEKSMCRIRKISREYHSISSQFCATNGHLQQNESINLKM
jgi:hypothetical protein